MKQLLLENMEILSSATITLNELQKQLTNFISINFVINKFMHKVMLAT